MSFVTAHVPGSGDGPLLLLLHGYGSHEQDLLPIAERIGLPALSVRAPLPMPWGGYAWAPRPEQPPVSLPDGEPYAGVAQDLMDWLDGSPEPAAPGRPVVPLGFSQGGLMVTELLRAAPERFAAGVVCSGFIAAGERPGDAALASTPVFFGRGDADLRVPAPWFEATAAWLVDHTSLTDRVYPTIGHEISPAEVRDITAFLGALATR